MDKTTSANQCEFAHVATFLYLLTQHLVLRGSITGIGHVPLKQNRVFIPGADHVIAGAVLFLVACCNVTAMPFISNQNQYLAHALSRANVEAKGDWFRNTVDPYPLFSCIAKLAYEWGGLNGFRVLAFFGTLVATTSVFLLAHLLAKKINRPGAALVGTVAIGLTLLPHTPHAFEGVAGQYVISTPAYLQPSMFGCFLLLATVCFFAAITEKGRPAKPLLGTAFALTALSCALHPTYIVSTIMLLAAAAIANAWQGEKPHILHFAFAGIVLIAITVLANPALLSMAFSSVAYNSALQRFAFERIPHHTRLFDWELIDLARFVIAVISVPIAAKKLNRPWLAHFLAASLIVGSTASLLVFFSGEAKLALLFPWRVSVLILPISFTVLAVWIASRIEAMAPHWNWRGLAIISSGFAALYGCAATLQSESPARTDERTVLVRETHPEGVGLVPLDSANVRLNASADIYVDWESPPYASNELVEWWRRVDQVRQLAHNVDQFCSIKWHASIRWMLLPAGEKTPTCASQWKVLGRTGNWRVLEKIRTEPNNRGRMAQALLLKRGPKRSEHRGR